MLAFVVSCQAAAEAPQPRPIETLDDFTAALSRSGVQHAELMAAPEPVFGLPGTALQVGGETVQVFEFESEAARRAVSDTIEAGGMRVGGRPIDWGGRPNIWASGRLLVVYVGTDGGMVLLLDGLLGDPLTLNLRLPDEPFPPAVSAAVAALSEQYGVPAESIEVVDYRPVEWPDSCLGAPAQGELCAQVITPGWIVMLQAEAQEYQLHTDEFGQQVRQP